MNNVVKHADSKKFSCLGQLFGDRVILSAWRGVAGGMIVTQDDCAGALKNCGLEHFARVNQGSIERADRYNYHALNSVLGIQTGDDKSFLVVAWMFAPVSSKEIFCFIRTGETLPFPK